MPEAHFATSIYSNSLNENQYEMFRSVISYLWCISYFTVILTGSRIYFCVSHVYRDFSVQKCVIHQLVCTSSDFLSVRPVATLSSPVSCQLSHLWEDSEITRHVKNIQNWWCVWTKFHIKKNFKAIFGGFSIKLCKYISKFYCLCLNLSCIWNKHEFNHKNTMRAPILFSFLVQLLEE